MNCILDTDEEKIVEVDDWLEEITRNGNREELVKQTQEVFYWSIQRREKNEAEETMPETSSHRFKKKNTL